MRRLGAPQPAVERPHRRPQLQPDGFRHRQHRRRLGAQVEGAVELEVGADVTHRIAVRDHIGNCQVDTVQPLDQRDMRPRQRPAGQLHLDQRAQRRQLLDAVVRQLGRGHPARRRQRQRAFGHQPSHRLAGRGHRDAVFGADTAQGERRAGGNLAIHDLRAQPAIDLVMGRHRAVGLGVDQHGATVITNLAVRNRLYVNRMR